MTNTWQQRLLAPSDSTAIMSSPHGKESVITYDELLTLRDRFMLKHAAVLQPGAHIGLLSTNCLEWLVAYYAVLHTGGIVVPISHKMPKSGVEFVSRDASLNAIFCDADRARTLAGENLPLISWDGGSNAGVDMVSPAPAEFASRPPNALGMILYTSGSTGQPKGVELANRTLEWITDTVAKNVATSQTRMLVAAPLNHIAALMFAMTCLVQGGTVVLLPKFDAREFLLAIGRYRVSDLTGVPPMFAMLAAHRDLLESLDFSSVTQVTMGSAPATDDLLQEVESWFPNAAVSVSYGTTESGPGVFGPHPKGIAVPRGSVGAALAVPETRLVDVSPENPRLGLLEVKSPSFMLGYRNRPDVRVPITDDGFHSTGDMFEIDEQGFYYFRGRKDDMFSSGGENIHPQAVEEVLESHPSVVAAVVVPIPDEVKGFKPVAFVLLHPHAQMDAEGLKRHVLERLEPFAHPRHIWALDQFPLAATNKVDRMSLQKRANDLLRAEFPPRGA